MAVKDIIRRHIPRAIFLWKNSLKQNCRVQLARLYHMRAVRRIRTKVKLGQRIKVLFIDSEISKWKAQTLFDLMKQDANYEPIIGVTIRDFSEGKSIVEIRGDIEKAKLFFASKGDDCVSIYDCDIKQPTSLDKIAPDIVFYQQPWYNVGCHNIEIVHRKALTCYEPYFVPNIGFPEFEAHMLFHRYLAYFFLLNKGWVCEYSRNVSKTFYSGRLLSVGHTMLDMFTMPNYWLTRTSKTTVIYAPHHSLTQNSLMKIGTFLENGREILRYAQDHRQFNWVFRPHPVLKDVLSRIDGWGEHEQARYYSDWASIGQVSEGGDYLDLFAQASAMITDCGSFLVEFAATGKPIIHLVSKNSNREPALPTRELLSTYYKVHDIGELRNVLDSVLLRGEDPLSERRKNAVMSAGLSGQNAAKNIMDFFDKKFRIKR